MKNFLIEELNRIQKIMGVQPLISEASVPGLTGIVATVKRIASQAARTGRAFAGDAQEISDALALLNRASGNLTDEFDALARLVKASPDFDNLISPSLINLINTLPNGSVGLGNIDNFITNSLNQGMDVSQIISQLEYLIEATFGNFPKGAKDILKQNYKKKLNSFGPQPIPGTNWIIPGTGRLLPSVSMTPAEIVGKLRSMFAGDPKAIKLINKAENQIKSYIPRSQQEALDILDTNKQTIQRLLLKSDDPKKWDWLVQTIKKNWATKLATGFFISLGVSYVFLGMMRLVGADLSTPICNFMDALFKGALTCDEVKSKLGGESDGEGELN